MHTKHIETGTLTQLGYLDRCTQLIQSTPLGQTYLDAANRIGYLIIVSEKIEDADLSLIPPVIYIGHSTMRLKPVEWIASIIMHELDHLYRYYYEKSNPKCLHGEYAAVRTQAQFLIEIHASKYCNKKDIQLFGYSPDKIIKWPTSKLRSTLKNIFPYSERSLYPDIADFTQEDEKKVTEYLGSLSQG